MSRIPSHLCFVYWDPDKHELKSIDIPYAELEKDGTSFNENITRFVEAYTPFKKILFLKDLDDNYYQVDITKDMNDGLTQEPNYFKNKVESLSTKKLPISSTKTYEVGEVYSVDSTYFDFIPTPVKIGSDPSLPFPLEDKHDYLLTKEGVDYLHLANTSLVTVNGLCHRLYGENNIGLFVQHGYRTTQRVNGIHINLMNFEDVGTVRTIDITDKNHVKIISDLKWTDGFYLHFPNENFSSSQFDNLGPSKMLGISLGGFIHLDFPYNDDDYRDPLIKRINHNTIKIDMRHFNLRNRIHQLGHLFEKGLVGLDISEEDRPVIFKEPLESEETFKALLNLSQTFLFVIESETPIYMREETIGRLTWPKRYWTKRKFAHYPIRLGDGRYPAFNLIDERIGFTIHTIENLKPYYFDVLEKRDKLPFMTYYQRTTVRPEIQSAKYIRIYSLKKKKV